MLHFSVVFIFSISFVCMNLGQVFEEEGCSPEQFAHMVLEHSISMCGGRLQLTQVGRPLQCFKVCPSFWQLLQRIGLGKYGRTEILRQATSIFSGSLYVSNVKSIAPVAVKTPSTFF